MKSNNKIRRFAFYLLILVGLCIQITMSTLSRNSFLKQSNKRFDNKYDSSMILPYNHNEDLFETVTPTVEQKKDEGKEIKDRKESKENSENKKEINENKKEIKENKKILEDSELLNNSKNDSVVPPQLTDSANDSASLHSKNLISTEKPAEDKTDKTEMIEKTILEKLIATKFPAEISEATPQDGSTRKEDPVTPEKTKAVVEEVADSRKVSQNYIAPPNIVNLIKSIPNLSIMMAPEEIVKDRKSISFYENITSEQDSGLGNILFLDRQGVSCPKTNSVIKAVTFQKNDKQNTFYKVTCTSHPNISNDCALKTTDFSATFPPGAYNDEQARKKLLALKSTLIECDNGSALKDFRLFRNPRSDLEVAYNYTCCKTKLFTNKEIRYSPTAPNFGFSTYSMVNLEVSASPFSVMQGLKLNDPDANNIQFRILQGKLVGLIN